MTITEKLLITLIFLRKIKSIEMLKIAPSFKKKFDKFWKMLNNFKKRLYCESSEVYCESSEEHLISCLRAQIGQSPFCLILLRNSALGSGHLMI